MRWRSSPTMRSPAFRQSPRQPRTCRPRPADRRPWRAITSTSATARSACWPALLELRIAAFQVVADLVRLYLLLIEDLAQRSLSQFAEAGVPLRRPMLTRMAGEQSRRPQFVGIAEFLGLAAGEVDNPCLGLGGDRRLPAGPRAIVERPHWAIGQRPLDTALDGL